MKAMKTETLEALLAREASSPFGTMLKDSLTLLQGNPPAEPTVAAEPEPAPAPAAEDSGEDNPAAAAQARTIMYLLGGMTGISTNLKYSVSEAKYLLHILNERHTLVAKTYPHEQLLLTATRQLLNSLSESINAQELKAEANQPALNQAAAEAKKALEEAQIALETAQGLEGTSTTGEQEAVKSAEKAAKAAQDKADNPYPVALGPNLRELEKILLSGAVLVRDRKAEISPPPPAALNEFMRHDHGKSAAFIMSILDALQPDAIPGGNDAYSKHELALLQQIKAWGADKLGSDNVIEAIIDDRDALTEIIDHDDLKDLACKLGQHLDKDHFLHECAQASAQYKLPGEMDFPRIGQGQGSEEELCAAMKGSIELSALEVASTPEVIAEEKIWRAFIIHRSNNNEEVAQWAPSLNISQLRAYSFTIIDLLGQASLGTLSFVKTRHAFGLSLVEGPGKTAIGLFPMYDKGVVAFSKENPEDQTPANAVKHFTKAVLDAGGLKPEIQEKIPDDLKNQVATGCLMGRMTSTGDSKPYIPDFAMKLTQILTRKPELKTAFDRSNLKIGYGPEMFATFIALHAHAQTAEGRELLSKGEAFNAAEFVATATANLNACMLNANEFMGDKLFMQTLLSEDGLETVLTCMKMTLEDQALAVPNSATGLTEVGKCSKINPEAATVFSEAFKAVQTEKAAVTIQRHVRGHLARKTKQIAAPEPAVKLVAKETKIAPQIPAPTPGGEQAAAGGKSPRPSGDDQ